MSELRPILERGENASGYLALFDESVRESELGLALHAVCDYLLEPGPASPESGIIENIRSLHGSMRIEDDCVDRLRQKVEMKSKSDSLQ